MRGHPPFQPGKPVRLSARFLNQLGRIADQFDQRTLEVGARQPRKDSDLDVVLVTNPSTEHDFQAFEIIGLGNPLDPPTADADEFPHVPAFQGLTGAPQFGRFAVLLEPLAKKTSGANPVTRVARAAIGGVVPARLRTDSTKRRWADVGRPNIGAGDDERTGDAKWTLRSRFAGSAEVLWVGPEIEGTSTTPPTKWAWVRLGNSGSPPAYGVLREHLYQSDRAEVQIWHQDTGGGFFEGNEYERETANDHLLDSMQYLPSGTWVELSHNPYADEWNVTNWRGCAATSP